MVAIFGPAPELPGFPLASGVGRQTPATGRPSEPRKAGGGLGLNPSVNRQSQMVSATVWPQAMPAWIAEGESAPRPEGIAAIEASRLAVSNSAREGYNFIRIAYAA